MANAPLSTLKRGVATAFGEDASQKSERNIQKRAKISKPPRQTAREVKPILSNNHPSKSQAGSSKPKRPPNSKKRNKSQALATKSKSGPRKGRKQEHGAPKTLTPAQQPSIKPDWTLSAPEAGRFLDHEPLLLQRDQFLVLAVRTRILVYATATSILVRSLRISENDKITSYILCDSNKDHLFLSTYSGLVIKWNWTTGQTVKEWRSSKKLMCISERWQHEESSSSSTMLLMHETAHGNRHVSLATFHDSSTEIVDGRVLLEETSLASWIRVLDKGRCVVVYGQNRMFLGQAIETPRRAPTDYIWRETVVPKDISTIDVRFYTLITNVKKTRLAVDIVVGCDDGSILIYDDVLFRLTAKEKNPSDGDIVSRRLHWHRKEVRTVRWSLDGNYIISGGSETVMVVWQLDTGQQQFLPHLSAAICQISVSETGSAYAIHLADNSVLVLSTSELLPTACISSLITKRRSWKKTPPRRTPVVFQPQDPSLISLAVPADPKIGSSGPATATLLQTFDVRAQQQSSRQALVRNNITALNVDPTGASVQEPDVIHLKISHDGKWLATVDEWIPPDHDLRALGAPSGDGLFKPVGKEIYLKFWARSESRESWELVTKIDSPHADQWTGSSPVLDLQASPRRFEYSTISSNGRIIIWTPKARHRNGLPVTNKSGSQLYNWTRTKIVEFPLFLENLEFRSSAALAYSPDGSVLAFSCNQSPFIQFVDPLTGILLHHTQQGSHPGPIPSHLSFLKHYLIAVSKDVRVYNTVSGELLYAFALRSNISDVFVAVNERDGTFALVCLLPYFTSGVKEGESQTNRYHITVFTPTSASPIYTKIMNGTIESLLPLPTDNGYLLINEEAELLYLRPRSGSGREATDTDVSLVRGRPTTATTGVENILERWVMSIKERGEEELASAGIDIEMEDGVGPPGQMQSTHKTQSSLADVFGRSSDMPVHQLFEQVVSALQGRKPKHEEGRQKAISIVQ